MFLTSRPCGAELPFMISHHQSYQRWKTCFFPPSPNQVGSGKSAQSFSDWLCNRGQKVYTTCLKCCRSAIRISHLGMAAYVWPPPTPITILTPLGLSPEMYNEGPPTKQTIVGSKFRQGDVANSGIPYSAPKVHRDIAIKMVFGG